jgi:ectoine hydroxylase-related dioxygenase (phytanoyl-CoA dioxygenase family)
LSFESDGYVLERGFFSRESIAEHERAIADLYLMQARKIEQYREIAERITSLDWEPGRQISMLCTEMEKTDKEALYQVQKLFPSSQACRKIFDDRFMAFCEELLGAKNLLLDGPALFINAPRSNRLLYKWHSETHYYPGRRKLLNIWFPVFDAKDKTNGAMSLKPGSHKKHYDRPAPYQMGENHFVQYEIPDNFHAEFPIVDCETVPGDVVAFDKNTVHTSNANQSLRYTFACVARVWTPQDDMTLAGNICGPEIGRAGLRVAA